MVIRSGALRHRVTIQRSTPGAPNAANERPLAWSALREVYASMELQSGTERFDGKQMIAAATYLFVTRFPFGITITPKDRLVLGTRIFDIESAADPEGRRRELQIVAREKLS